MKKIAALLALVLWTGIALAGPLREILVDVTNVGPTQMEIGKAHVLYSEKKIETKAALLGGLAQGVLSRALPGGPRAR